MQEIMKQMRTPLLALFLVLIAVLYTTSYRISILSTSIFALVLTTLYWKVKGRKKLTLPLWTIFVAGVIALLLRVVPLLQHGVPLGYDPGLYLYLFENPFGQAWTKELYPLLFTVVFGGLTKLVGSTITHIPLFVVASVSVLPASYYAVKDKRVATLVAVLAALSIAQFHTYQLFYYKNVIAIGILLLALTQANNHTTYNWKLLLYGGILAGLHRPAMFILGASTVVHAVWNYKKNTKWTYIHITVLAALVFILNFDRVPEYVLAGVFRTATETLGASSGTFANLTAYLQYSLLLIPFALLGFLTEKKKGTIWIAGLVCLAIVVGRFFFYNRFIIYLDIFLIIYAAKGLLRIANKYVLAAVLILATIGVAQASLGAAPLIDAKEFAEIQELPTEGTLIVTDRHYSPWIKGYVDTTILAPGLFDENLHDKAAWNQFWQGIGREEFVKQYEKPIYVYEGKHQEPYIFNDPCLPAIRRGEGTLYTFIC